MPKRNPVAEVRRAPRQQRALETCQSILDASAYILRSKGLEDFNTNRIAERAGMSIGAVYQYYPDKQAILRELALRELAADREAVVAALVQSARDSKLDPARVGLRALIAAQRERGSLRRAIFSLLDGDGQRVYGETLRASFAEVSTTLRELAPSLLPARIHTPTHEMLFVLSRSVVGALRAAAVEEPSLLDSPAFEDHLVRLVRGFFAYKQ